MKYEVWCRLETTDIVEADSEEDAFIQLSEDLIAGGSWDYSVTLVDEEDDE